MTTVDDLLGALPTARLIGVVGDRSTPVTDIVQDSRQASDGAMFACLPGASVDGHDHAADAVAAGARSLLVQRRVDLGIDVEVVQVVVDDVRAVIGPVAAAFHGDPSRSLTVIGITGTNGKTTCAAMIAAIFRAARHRVAVLGTLSGPRTTPEACDLQRFFAHQLAAGVDTVVMEVSSHALEMRRIDGAHLDVAVFTNLGRDHLDLHGSMEAYFRAKARLFEPDLSRHGVVNVDDVHGRLLADTAGVEITESSAADVTVSAIEVDRLGMNWRGHEVVVPIGGEFNLVNARLALEVTRVCGIDPSTAVAGLAQLESIPGRFEVVIREPCVVVVDYAHTPEGLGALIRSVRKVAAEGRVIIVFGCGGDRDRDKRPSMGAAAAGADVVIVTSDNPRTEDPNVIIDQIVEGIPQGTEFSIEIDRARAISYAIDQARTGDVVVIAGKGHETTQEIDGIAHPFDDREIARRRIEALR